MRRASERSKPSPAIGSPPRPPDSRRTAFLAPTCARGEWQVAQSEAFTNPSGCATDGIPCVVVQSDLLHGLATRLTMPLAVLDVATKVPAALCPVIMVKGQRLHAMAHGAAPLPARALQRPVDTVASQASALVSALDAVLSGIWLVPIGTAAARP